MKILPPEQDYLEDLFRLHAKQVRAYAIRRVGADQADDVVSETFTVAWQKRQSVGDPALPWLLRTAHNIIAHQSRSTIRRLKIQSAVSHHRPVLATASAEDQGRALAESVLEALPPLDAEILRLTAWEQLTPAEIAIVLDLGDSTVRSKLMRARQRAQKLLQEAEDEPSPSPVPLRLITA